MACTTEAACTLMQAAGALKGFGRHHQSRASTSAGITHGMGYMCLVMAVRQGRVQCVVGCCAGWGGGREIAG